MIVEFEGKKIDIEIEGAVHDYDYWCDAFIERAYFEDTGKEVPEELLDKLNDYMNNNCQWIIDWLY